jgi:hypothetical protein
VKVKNIGCLAASLFLILIFAVPGFPYGGKKPVPGTSAFYSVRAEKQNGTLRVALITGADVGFDDFALTNPARIVVDFRAARNEFGYKTIPLSGFAIERIRVGEPRAGIVRVVLDSPQPVKYTVAREGNSVVISVSGEAASPRTGSAAPAAADDPGPAPKQRAERRPGDGLTPRVEIFGGYQYVRTDGPVIGDHNANGWTASVSGNFNRYFGITTEFSGHWGSPGFTDFKPLAGLPLSGNLDYSTFGVLAGPRFTMREGRTTVYGHALFGVAHISFNKAKLTEVLGILGQQPSGFSSNSFAAAFGGGIDVRLSRTVSLRAIQADYVLTHFRDLADGERHNQNNIRVSTGVVFRLGDVR